VGTEDTILSKTAPSGWVNGGKEFFLHTSNNRTFLGSFAIPDVSTTATILADGLWHHVTYTFTNSSNVVNIYVDGVLSGSGNMALAPDVAGHVMRLGANPPHFFHGQMDELRIYNRVLSQSEIQTIMNLRVTSSP
jgi:hypothetical protein